MNAKISENNTRLYVMADTEYTHSEQMSQTFKKVYYFKKYTRYM